MRVLERKMLVVGGTWLRKGRLVVEEGSGGHGGEMVVAEEGLLRKRKDGGRGEVARSSKAGVSGRLGEGASFV